MGEKESFEDRANVWMARNPLAYELLVQRSVDHARRQETFSIRQLCEKLRWERQHGILKGSESYAIPNEITRYVGIAIMRDHPETEPYMTTRLPSGTNATKSDERKRNERLAYQKVKAMSDAELRAFVDEDSLEEGDSLEDSDPFNFFDL